jgi:signal transduction histidine kinase/ligand-binding sensor domain-containing protein
MTASVRPRRWLGGLAGLLLASVACAAPPLSLGSYQHTALTKQDGAPGDLASIAQSADGFLWMAGTKGLTRFDGVSFSAFRPAPGEHLPAAQLNVVFPAEGGGLWLADSDHGPTLLKDGHLRQFGRAQGGMDTVRSFFSDPRGGVWAIGNDGLAQFRGSGWHMVERVVPGQPVRSGVFDAGGTLWLVRGDAIRVRRPGAAVFADVAGGPERPRSIFAGRSGRLYVLTPTAVHIYRGAGTALTEATAPLPVAAATFVQEDGEGALWVTSYRQGVIFVSPDALRVAESQHAQPVFETMSRPDGLSGSFAWPMLLDREGNLWVGTENGLDRFRRSAFTRMKLPDGVHEVSASVDGEGVAWVGSDVFPLLRLRPPSSWEETPIPTLAMATHFDARSGVVWAATDRALWSITRGVPSRVAAIGEGALPASTLGVASDSRGRVYIATNRRTHNVLAWDGHDWTDVTTLSLRPKVIVVDAADAIWVGGAGETRLARIAGGVTRAYGEADGLQDGVIRALAAEADGLWIGGDRGIQHFDGKRFIPVGAPDEEAFETTTGLAKDAGGNLWIQTLDGVRKVAAADLAPAFAQPGRFVPYRAYDATDGVPGGPDPDHTLPTLRRATDGTLWAQTTTGLAWVDPRKVPESRFIPPVYVEEVTDGRLPNALRLGKAVLPPDVRSFRVGYTSPMLSRPERVRFRYRLVGYSDTWQEAGSRREATFTNVPPGTYRFEAVAISESGVVGAPASAQIERQPAYHETWWFRALGILPLLALLWTVYELRTRALTRRLRIRAEEREAVARDIHDTLLQRFQGVMLTVQAWALDKTIPADRRAEMLETSGQARDALVEVRERILLLRSAEDPGLALYDRIAAEGRRLEALSGMTFRLEVNGTPQALSAECRNELRDIAFETLRNAFLHSHGTLVSLTLSYAGDALWLVVTDDGRGFDSSAAAKARESGHVGLVGLHERVQRLGGTLRVESAPGEGTEVHIKVPARNAYSDRRRWWAVFR